MLLSSMRPAFYAWARLKRNARLVKTFTNYNGAIIIEGDAPARLFIETFLLYGFVIRKIVPHAKRGHKCKKGTDLDFLSKLTYKALKIWSDPFVLV